MHRLQCKCGKVKGHVLSGSPSNRMKCYCTDCQAFGRFFGQAARVLDAKGGTEIVQVCQSRLCFDQGIDQLASIRLSDHGMIRWYTQCCQTPIGNTMPDPKMSFIGLIHTAMDLSAIDKDFGEKVAFINTSAAIGEPKPQQRGVVGTIFRFARLVITSRIFGRYKQSPLFTATGAPIAPPRILSSKNSFRSKNILPRD